MGRAEDDKWLDEVLDKAIASRDTQPDFETWKANHPEAVRQITTPAASPASRHVIRSITMNGWFVKLAAAAVIIIATVVGITQLTFHAPDETGLDIVAEALRGPMTYEFPDGSTVALAPGASIFPFTNPDIRGFEHAAGTVDVTVAKGKSEFIVRTPYGDIKALGTQFRLDLVDGVAENTKEEIQLLSVEVTEGKVEVSNDKGKTTLGAKQDIIVEKDAAPYDFSRDESLPARLRERVASAVAAMQAGDAAAHMANYNVDYMFRLVKGQEEYDPQRFGGSEADLERIRQACGDVASADELTNRFLAMGGVKAQGKLYVRSVTLNEARDHAQAHCLERKSAHHLVITTPQWHYFDNDWWQVDD
jgi:ferric-dicitrate binding protein FerR (iron transport regulator)